jgi:hypothetical protein
MGCGRERHLAARVGTFRNSMGNSTINLWHQPNWLQCFQGAKVRNWTQSKIIIIIGFCYQMSENWKSMSPIEIQLKNQQKPISTEERCNKPT